MEKLRELMKEHQDKADKKVMGEVLELLQREPGLFVVTVHATKNFFLGAENGKAAAFLYTSREYADEFVKGLEMVGVETKVLEIRPLQRISFFNDLYRSGFEAVVIDKGQENHMSMSLFSIIETKGYIRDRDEPVPGPFCKSVLSGTGTAPGIPTDAGSDVQRALRCASAGSGC